jgi:hypothetical protein
LSAEEAAVVTVPSLVVLAVEVVVELYIIHHFQ